MSVLIPKSLLSKFVLQHAPWSMSKAETAKTCPYKFHRKYVEKEKGVVTTAEAVIGSTVHKALEYYFKNTSLITAFEIAVKEFNLTTKEIESVYALFPNASDFVKKFSNYRIKNPSNDPQIELKLGITIDGTPAKFFDNTNCFFRGAIDLLLEFKSDIPSALVLDHKTGKLRGVEHFTETLNAYILLTKVSALPTVQRAIVALNYIKENQILFSKSGWQQTTDINPYLISLYTFLNEATKNAHDPTITNTSPLCSWCEYQMSCPAQK